jgi:hypothetical protein
MYSTPKCHLSRMVARFGMTERCPSNKTTAVRIKARINGVLITSTENQTREYNKEQEDEVTTGSRRERLHSV